MLIFYRFSAVLYLLFSLTLGKHKNTNTTIEPTIGIKHHNQFHPDFPISCNLLVKIARLGISITKEYILEIVVDNLTPPGSKPHTKPITKPIKKLARITHQ